MRSGRWTKRDRRRRCSPGPPRAKAHPALGRRSRLPTEPSETLTVRDNRTGQTYELEIADGAIRATDLRQITSGAGDHGLMTYDPGLFNTAVTRSRVTYLDGEAGILQYRG